MVSAFPHSRGYAAYGYRPTTRPGTLSAAAAIAGGETDPALAQTALFGIPYQEATPAVRRVVRELCDKLDALNFSLANTQERLQELESQVDIEPVTGLYNRRAFIRKLDWSLSMFERYGHHFSLVYFDLNNLKSINDRYGHAAGDMAIRHTARILSQNMRESDFLARIGGDEFVMIMHYATENAAIRRAKRMADKVLESRFMFNGQPLSISVASGVYTIREGDNAESALHHADVAMYKDKEAFHGLAHSHVSA